MSPSRTKRSSTAATSSAARGAQQPGYWLVKTEPSCFSFADLWAAPKHTTGWGGVRNYQARNFMRQGMRLGDGVLVYHSNAEPAGVAGLAEVVRLAYPDPTQFDPKDEHFDPASSHAAPRWFQVDLCAKQALTQLLALETLRAEPRLAGLELLRRGSRLSVHPVSREHWLVVLELAGLSKKKS